MAEILLKAVNAVHSDPDVDKRGCYKRGDPVVVMPDGWEWGTQESKPPAEGGNFMIVKIPGVTPDQVTSIVKGKWAGMNALTDSEVDQDSKPSRRRRISIDVDSLPASVLQALNTTGQYTTTWAEIKSFVRNKSDNSTAA